MGDHADDLIDQMWNEPEDMEPEDGDGPSQRTKVCRCCGKRGLHWVNVGKWRLADVDDKVHVCPVAPLPPEPKRRKPGFFETPILSSSHFIPPP